MASTIENSFGARLARAQKMLGCITNFQNFNPPRREETIEGFREFIDFIFSLNKEETGLEQAYNMIVKTRENLFYEDENCITKLLAMIRDSVEAQYGKDSIEFNQIDSLVRQMRNSTPAIKAATADTPEGKVSQSERSYGSLTQYFGDLVTILSHLMGYQSSNPILQIPHLEGLVAQANQLAVEVAMRRNLLTTCRDRRRDAYEELKSRGSRIKAYSRSHYGLNSSEYKQIKGIAL
ncbi:MAG: hypothetical protein SFU99_20425 [Saprospiraceae bacterium]|nr:hypothetical protein [Saprospiraceae bacterium]